MFDIVSPIKTLENADIHSPTSSYGRGNSEDPTLKVQGIEHDFFPARGTSFWVRTTVGIHGLAGI